MVTRPTLAGTMTPFPHFIREGCDLAEAARYMEQHTIRHLPVMGPEESIVGVLSQRGLAVARAFDEQAATVGDVCSRNPYIVPLREPLERVVTTMAERHLTCAVVVRDGRLAGMLTTTDVLQLLVELLGGDPGPEPEPETA